MDLISTIVAMLPEAVAWMQGDLPALLAWICIAFALIGGSAVSIAIAQTRVKRPR